MIVFFIFFLIFTLLCSLYIGRRLSRFGTVQRFIKPESFLYKHIALIPIAISLLLLIINMYAAFIIVLHLCLFWLICDAVGAIVRRIRRRDFERYYVGGAAILLSAVYLSVGWFCAHHVFETTYKIETDADLAGGSLRIVLITDSHLGATLDGEDFAKELERVQACEPDLVVITGDFVDDDSTREDMLVACRALGKLRTKMGVYFVFGNHDKGYFNSRDFSEFELRGALSAAGVKVMEDEVLPIDGSFCLIGRKDRSVRDRKTIAELASGLESKYTVVLDHQPNDYENEAVAGVDLVLSGHTHGGHIFPAGPIGLLMGANDKVYGHEKIDGTDFIVSSGISGWAIPFKTGAISEYVVIDITSK